MIVYHGSNKPVEQPDIKHSNKYLDFGKGFYVTVYKDQAEKWAMRKAMRYGGTPIVTIYEFTDEDVRTFCTKDFTGNDSEWLDFVCACRKGENIYMQYDVIMGNVADDDVFKSVDMYFRGIWDKNRTLEEIRYFNRSNQITFTTQNAIDRLLKFVEYYEAGEQNG